MMISVASFIIISIYLTKYFGNHGLWFSLFLFMILRALTLKVFIKTIKMIKKITIMEGYKK